MKENLKSLVEKAQENIKRRALKRIPEQIQIDVVLLESNPDTRDRLMRILDFLEENRTGWNPGHWSETLFPVTSLREPTSSRQDSSP